jgi:squalene-associated FAD-dependent desaturase
MRVVVVGGGFAGLAAAIQLQERRHQVTLLERRGVLGGRATSFGDTASGEDVDNGTHLMVGAYTATLDLLRRAGAEDLLLRQDDLRIDYADERGRTALRCARLAAPWHLLAGLLGLALPWRARFDAVRLALAVRLGRPPRGLTLHQYFERTRQGDAVRRLLWGPLATAILNESAERASAVLFYNVFREAFLRRRDASPLVFLRAGWARLHDRLAGYLQSRGGLVRRRALAQAVEIEGGHAVAVRFQQRAETREAIRAGCPSADGRLDADAVVLAVPWHAVGALLPEEVRAAAPFAGLGALGASPIVSVELWLDRIVVDEPMIGLGAGEIEWVFDKGRLFGRAGAPQHLAFIASAAWRSLPRPNAEVVAAAETALRRRFPGMAGARVERSLVLREPQATFTCTPEAEALRPGPRTPVDGLYLAGDWTDTSLPATIEGAVRSGLRAAEMVDAGPEAPR